MKAEDVPFTQLLEGPKQFIIPVFQRDYSWGTKQCLQLWKDVVRVGKDPLTKAHFVGSVVYIAAEETSANITRWLLIDGQQRISTVTLLLAALRTRLQETVNHSGEGDEEDEDDDTLLPTPLELDDYYLTNKHGKGARRHKLCLRRADQDTLSALLDGKSLPPNPSQSIRENYEFFLEQLATADLEVVYRGVKKLVAVDVSLTRGQDDPQMIFESLNSTGLDLTQADLIRNFVLMRQEESRQTELYEGYWHPIEIAFGSRYRTDFDRFVRDYLTLQLRPNQTLRTEEIYQRFRDYYHRELGRGIEPLLADLKRFGLYYAAYNLGWETDDDLRLAFERLRTVVDVASPVILRLYEALYEKTLTRVEFLEAVALLESYVFRRAVCDMQTRSLGNIFVSLAVRIDPKAPFRSLTVALFRQGESRKFPTDQEFRERLETRDVYHMRNARYLLDRIENDSKEKIDTTLFSIEHVMPQNDKLGAEWRAMLGPDWQPVHATWLHRLGNLTLTGYNSTYSDRPFEKKKSIAGGFDDSPLRLNKRMREAKTWNEAEMAARGEELAKRALGVWPALEVDLSAVREAELAERKALSARYPVEKLDMDTEARRLFDLLRSRILDLDGVLELGNARSVSYRAPDFFLEVLPRKRSITLLLNLEFDETDDPAQLAYDVSGYAFITHATESGGVAFNLRSDSQLEAALHVLQQAYEKATQ